MAKRVLPILIGIIVLRILFITFTNQKIKEVTNINYDTFKDLAMLDISGDIIYICT